MVGGLVCRGGVGGGAAMTSGISTNRNKGAFRGFNVFYYLKE